MITLAIAGAADRVCLLLPQLTSIIRPSEAPSTWIAQLKHAVREAGAPATDATPPGSVIDSNGLLHLDHADGTDELVSVRLHTPVSSIAAL